MEFLNYVHMPFGYLLPFIAALTIIVFIHELGHFMVARWCGVAVEVFSIGFGREIFGWNGSQQTFQRVPCLSFQPKISRPKPIENTSTATPHQRATRKWPSSWMKTIIVRAAMNGNR